MGRGAVRGGAPVAGRARRFVYDIETDGFSGRELLAVIRWGPEPTARKAFWGRGATYRAICYAIRFAQAEGLTAELWAHFGGGFDLRHALPQLVRDCERAEALSVGSLVLRFWGRMPAGGRFDIRDSIRLLPGSLDAIGRELGIAKGRQSHRHRRGACACASCLYRRDRPRLLRYCDRDTLILWTALDRTDRLLAELGLDRPRLTLASCAAATILAPLPKQARPWTPHGEHEPECEGGACECAREDLDRETEAANFGGRVEPFFWGPVRRARSFDVQQSYPTSMVEGPLPWRYEGEARFTDRLAGTVEANVTVPEDCAIPVLPWREPETGRLYWPVGSWRGRFIAEELRYAVDVGAARVRRVYGAQSWQTSDRMGEWVLDIVRRRQEAKRAGLRFGAFFWKRLSVSGYGKTVERREHDRFVLRPDSAEGLRRVHDDLPLWWKEISYQPALRNVVTGATITARARVRLHRWLAMAAGRGRVYYCDTDSVICSGELPTGAELGDLEDQGTITDARFYAPKLYRYTIDGETIVRAKGLPGLTAAGLDRLMAGGEHRFGRHRSFREGARIGDLGFAHLEVARRWLCDTRPKRRPVARGVTVPWTVRGGRIVEPWSVA